MKIQDSKFEAICIGRSDPKLSKKLGQTFFIVVESQDLIAIRTRIAELYKKRTKQESKKFDPKVFYPHITLGFTQRDLHILDGVVKDKNWCFAKLEE